MNVTNSNLPYGNLPSHNRYGNFISGNTPAITDTKNQKNSN